MSQWHILFEKYITIETATNARFKRWQRINNNDPYKRAAAERAQISKRSCVINKHLSTYICTYLSPPCMHTNLYANEILARAKKPNLFNIKERKCKTWNVDPSEMHFYQFSQAWLEFPIQQNVQLSVTI